MAAFGVSFLQYFIIFLILVAVAVAGAFIGIAMRKRKDAKMMEEHQDKKEEN